MVNSLVKNSDHVRVFFNKFPNSPFPTPVLRKHQMTKDMFVNTLKKFMQSGKENLLSKGWGTTFIVTAYPAKISPRESN